LYLWLPSCIVPQHYTGPDSSSTLDVSQPSSPVVSALHDHNPAAPTPSPLGVC
jgi:hypothetical protein